MDIVIIDYGIGNIRSIYNALESLNFSSVIISRDIKKIMSSDVLILPGVGSFKHGMQELEKYNLIKVINDFAQEDKKIIGICLGMQLLFDSSDEFEYTKGLGLIPGEIKKLNSKKLPNISWQRLKFKDENTTYLDGIIDSNTFYFIHSFACKNYKNKSCIAYSSYEDENFVAIVKKDNIIGCQFHPEKSGKYGLKLLYNLLK